MSETVLGEKVKDAINTTWAATPEPKPTLPRVKGVVLLCNGGLLLELDLAEAADWMCDEANHASILRNIGSGASIKNRSYQVIVQFIPVRFDPDDDEMCRDFETTNDLQPNSILKTEWIKPVKDRRENQRVATARFYLKDAKSVNAILSRGAYVFGRKVVPKKSRRGLVRCLHCQLFGHKRQCCTSKEPQCTRCAMGHATDECGARLCTFTCRNCEGHHTSFDRECPKFIEKCAQLDTRCLENNLTYYPTDKPWSWAATTVIHTHKPHAGEGWDAHNRSHGQGFRTSANSLPVGHPPPPPRPQSNQDTPQ